MISGRTVLNPRAFSGIGHDTLVPEVQEPFVFPGLPAPPHTSPLDMDVVHEPQSSIAEVHPESSLFVDVSLPVSSQVASASELSQIGGAAASPVQPVCAGFVWPMPLFPSHSKPLFESVGPLGA